MRRTRLLCAIGLGLWTGGLSGCQKAPAISTASESAASGAPAASTASEGATSAALSEALRAHLRDGRFQDVAALRGLPIGVRSGLDTLFGDDNPLGDIAEPGAEFQMAGQPPNRKLPFRRLVNAGCSNDFYCVVYYERGGTERNWRVALFHWTPDETRFEWGGTAPGGLATFAAVRKAILSGTIKGGASTW